MTAQWDTVLFVSQILPDFSAEPGLKIGAMLSARDTASCWRKSLQRAHPAALGWGRALCHLQPAPGPMHTFSCWTGKVATKCGWFTRVDSKFKVA